MVGFIYLGMVAIVTATLGVVVLVRRVSLVTRGACATGHFVRWETRGIRRRYFHPVVRFRAHNGKDYEFIGGPGSRAKKKEAAYKVIYPPSAPEKAAVFSFLAFWAAPPAFFILSAAAALAAFHQLSR